MFPMTHAASISRLLRVLHNRAPSEVDRLEEQKRIVQNGLLSVGLKLHCLAGERQF
jgi:hypothetical protein